VGSGYNFIMVGGEASGTPRKLLLTAQKGAAFNPAPQNQVKSDDDGPELDGPDPNAVVLPPPDAPTGTPPPPPESEDENTRMQRSLQKLRPDLSTPPQ
jgi:hypothetical protein